MKLREKNFLNYLEKRERRKMIHKNIFILNVDAESKEKN